jgi:hypothetical protein
MNGPAHSSRADKIDIEHRLLAALCHPELDQHTRTTILLSLSDYRFTAPDHEVVYRALSAISAKVFTATVSSLTQAVTRMGFPDIDLRGLFTGPALTPRETASLLARLKS